MIAATNAVTLLLNGLTLSLALSFLIILMWNDPRREIRQFFAVFLGMVMLWYLGALLVQALALVDMRSALVTPALFILEFGFTGSSIALYAMTTVLVKLFSRRFRILLLAALFIFLAYRLVLFTSGAPTPFVLTENGDLTVHSRESLLIFYLIFSGGSLYLLVRYRRKIRSRALQIGLLTFIIGQSIGFLNPDLQSFTLSTSISAIATLVIGFALLQQEIIRPLAERNSQVEAIRKAISSIASQSAVDTVLSQMARQSVELLNADGAAIFLLEDGELRLKTTHELPADLGGVTLRVGEGVAGTVVKTSQLIQLDDYARQWRDQPDFAIARDYFGAVLCSPLLYGGDAIGAMMIIAARHGRLFDREDAYLLQLLAAQTAVAITQSKLFNEQSALTRQVEQSRSQLETVLVSTDSPVIAVDRAFQLIFANPAAYALFHDRPLDRAASLAELLPASAFPPNMRDALRGIRKKRGYTYEATIGETIYLCHVAGLGKPRLQGFVAVLNDITQLKELDRLKSEMVRMTSHDLKNPLQAAIANLDLLRDDAYDDGSKDVRESIDVIDRQLQRMNRIIRGVLDLERVKQGSLALEICAPERIIMDAVEELREYAGEQRVTLTFVLVQPLPMIACDAEQFKRALVNLIENAIKFTPSGGSVKIICQPENDEVIFAVKDSGVGIAPEQQERVFDRFYRGKQKGVEHVSGSGVGLSLVKTIVANHHGRIWLESEVGSGTTFYIAVPFA
jgi:signal transduction histidine kinase